MLFRQDYLSSFGDPELVGKTAQENPAWLCHCGIFHFAAIKASFESRTK
jgi:hypothetical protein